MRTKTFQVYGLRGIDLRWRAKSNSAAIARDLTWDGSDAWKNAGGSIHMDGYPGQAKADSNFSSSNSTLSLHWYSQHNGAVQWLMWEREEDSGRSGLFYLQHPTSYITVFNALTGLTETTSSPLKDVEGTIVDINGTGWDGTAANKSRTVISSPRSPSQSETYGGRIYIVNGHDEPIVFNGRYTDRAGFSSGPSAPIATVVYGESQTGLPIDETGGDPSMGLGTDKFVPGDSGELPVGAPASAYRYRVTYLNERGQESPLSAASEVVSFSVDVEGLSSTFMKDSADDDDADAGDPYRKRERRFITIKIPTGGSEVVARRVYRTADILDEEGNATLPSYAEGYYFLKEIQDNASTIFEDGLPDAMLGSLVDEIDFGPWPTTAKFLASFKNTMFISGMNTNDVQFSAPGMPEIYPADNVLSAGSSEAGEITGMYATRNALVVFKRRGIYLIKGDALSGFTIDTLTKDVGCSSQNSIREVPGVGLLFLSDSAIYALQGTLDLGDSQMTRVVEVSTTIRDHLARLNRSALERSTSAIYHEDREYWLSIPVDGSTQPNLVLVFHYEVGSWSYRENYPISCMLETGDHRGSLFFGTHEDGAMPLQVYGRGYNDKSGTAIEPLYRTAPLDYGSVYHSIQPAYINVYCIGYGTSGLELNFATNRSQDQVYTSDKSKPQKDIVKPLSVWGTAIWGSDKWGYWRPIPLRFDVSASNESLVTEVQVSFAPGAKSFQIIGYDLEAKVGEQRNISLLTDVLTAEKP